MPWIAGLTHFLLLLWHTKCDDGRVPVHWLVFVVSPLLLISFSFCFPFAQTLGRLQLQNVSYWFSGVNACTCYSSNRLSKFAFALFAGHPGHLAPCGLCAAWCHLNAAMTRKWTGSRSQKLSSYQIHSKPFRYDTTPHIVSFEVPHRNSLYHVAMWYHKSLCPCVLQEPASHHLSYIGWPSHSILPFGSIPESWRFLLDRVFHGFQACCPGVIGLMMFHIFLVCTGKTTKEATHNQKDIEERIDSEFTLVHIWVFIKSDYLIEHYWRFKVVKKLRNFICQVLTGRRVLQGRSIFERPPSLIHARAQVRASKFQLLAPKKEFVKVAKPALPFPARFGEISSEHLWAGRHANRCLSLAGGVERCKTHGENLGEKPDSLRQYSVM